MGLADVENALFYLSRIEAIKIEGGFLVVYNKLTIERLEKNNYKQYTSNDYGNSINSIKIRQNRSILSESMRKR